MRRRSGLRLSPRWISRTHFLAAGLKSGRAGHAIDHGDPSGARSPSDGSATLSAGGRLLLTLGEPRVPGAGPAHFNLPTDVAVLPDGSFYVSDGYKNTRVVKFHADGRYEFEWGGKGTEPGEFHLPHGIAVDAGGRVHVCDRENLRLQVFDPQGRFLAQWHGPRIGKPYGVEIGPQGHVFIIDGGLPKLRPAERGKVVELDATGAVIETFGVGQFELGHDLAVGPDGAVYVADATARRVRKFVPAR